MSSLNKKIKNNQAIEFNPSLAEVYVNRGDLRINLNQYIDAIQDYNMAIKLDPNCALAYYNRANSKYFLGDDEGANKDWRKASELGLTHYFRNINTIYKYNPSGLSI
ncbi:MAG: tetratricopeptide repeat protein [Ignavibacteriaceae bacterium]|nr:tetratricopeptide repeat protein [Ignavibacteriaceae bacterium]